MDIEQMSGKILRVPNPMIRESLLPDLPSADLDSDGVRVSAFDQLDRTFQRHIPRWRMQQMNMIGHKHILVNCVSLLIAIGPQQI